MQKYGESIPDIVCNKILPMFVGKEFDYKNLLEKTEKFKDEVVNMHSIRNAILKYAIPKELVKSLAPGKFETTAKVKDKGTGKIYKKWGVISTLKKIVLPKITKDPVLSQSFTNEDVVIRLEDNMGNLSPEQKNTVARTIGHALVKEGLIERINSKKKRIAIYKLKHVKSAARDESSIEEVPITSFTDADLEAVSMITKAHNIAFYFKNRCNDVESLYGKSKADHKKILIMRDQTIGSLTTRLNIAEEKVKELTAKLAKTSTYKDEIDMLNRKLTKACQDLSKLKGVITEGAKAKKQLHELFDSPEIPEHIASADVSLTP